VLDKVNAHPECEFQSICQNPTELYSIHSRSTGGLAVPQVSRRNARGQHMKVDIKSFLIGALLVAVAFLGYLYWDRQRNTVEIKLPSISIEKR
jgi:hypothetical protein